MVNLQQYMQSTEGSYIFDSNKITVPADQLEGIVQIPLGFQPFGIFSRIHKGQTEITIASYFEPAVCLADVTIDKKGLHLAIEWIRRVKCGDQNVRIFPDLLVGNEPNRTQTVNFGPNSTIWVSRNVGRQFFVLRSDDSGWALDGKKFLLPGEGMMHIASLHGEKLLTMETGFDGKDRKLRTYGFQKEQFVLAKVELLPPGFSGITMKDEEKWFITDSREGKRGIFREFKCVVPNVTGHDLCFLHNGGILFTYYGHSSPNPLLEPGQLVYVPPSLLR